MIKGTTKDVLWVGEGLLAVSMLILFGTATWGPAVACALTFVAILFLIGGGSKVDAMFLLYPFGAFIVFVGGGMALLFHYWHLFYKTGPQVLWLGNHPGVTIAWLGFGLIGGILISMLSYTLLFEKYVISESDWQNFVEEAAKLSGGEE